MFSRSVYTCSFEINVSDIQRKLPTRLLVFTGTLVMDIMCSPEFTIDYISIYAPINLPISIISMVVCTAMLCYLLEVFMQNCFFVTVCDGFVYAQVCVDYTMKVLVASLNTSRVYSSSSAKGQRWRRCNRYQ